MGIIHARFAQNHMATTFEFLVSVDERARASAESALARAHVLVAKLENELTEFREISPVFQLNSTAPGVEIPLPESTCELLIRSERLRDQTRGAFDCQAKSIPGSTRIRWDVGRQVAWRTDRGGHLGFGAIGKGFALDRVRTLLEAEGLHDWVLNAGGSSILISGFAGPQTPWTFGWSWTRDAEGNSLGVPFEHPSGTPIAIGVSGTHEKGLHLINPADGLAARSLQSAFVAHSSATDADALSTALFVAGWENGAGLLRDLPSASPAAAVIDRECVPSWNGAFARLWQVPEKWLATLALLLSTGLALAPLTSRCDDTVDLSALGADAETFNPYLTERNIGWALLPLLMLCFVLLHLKKYRPPTKKKTQLVQATKL